MSMKFYRNIYAALSAIAVMTASCVEEPYIVESANLMSSLVIDMEQSELAKVYVDETTTRTLPLVVGETVVLGFISNPANLSELTHAGVAWSSSDTDVAEVDDSGVLTAKSEGTAIISVTPSTVNLVAKATLKVKVVREVVEVTDIQVKDDSDHRSELSEYPSCYIGETMNLRATIMPEDATYRTVLWTSSDESVAHVDPISGVVTGVSSGEVDIIASSLDGAELTVSHRIFIDKIINPEGFKVLNAPEEDDIFSIGQISYALDVETQPAISTKSKIVWTSDNPSVATIDNKGVVTFHGFGSVVIKGECPASDAHLEDGFTREVELTFTVPAGYYKEEFSDERCAAKWQAVSGGRSTYHPATEVSEAYNLYTPGVQDALKNLYRVDAKRTGNTYLTRTFPYICIRVDDVLDNVVKSRALKLDTSGSSEDGTKVYGDFGGGSGTWYKKYYCSDGSSILIYDLSTQKFKEDVLLPENQIATLTTFCLKYADILLPEGKTVDDISYRMFWFNTFRSEEEMEEYLTDWSERTKVTWGSNAPGQEPDQPEEPGEEEPEPVSETGLKVLNAPQQGTLFSMSQKSYVIDCEKAESATQLVWESSDTGVATVDASGKVSFVSPGKVTISVSCSETEAAVKEGYVLRDEVQIEIPAGYYCDGFADAAIASTWQAASGGTVTYIGAAGTSEAHNVYMPAVQGNGKYRVDAKRSGTTYLTREFPILCFRFDDVNDGNSANTRNINIDTVGSLEDGTEFKGNFGGPNNKWKAKYRCSDGSAIFIYDLSSQSFPTGGVLPEGKTCVLNTFCIKYADIPLLEGQTVDEISYRMFWFNTFRSMEEMRNYLADWTDITGLTYTE